MDKRLVSNDDLAKLSMKYEVPVYLVQNLQHPTEDEKRVQFKEFTRLRNDLSEFILAVQDNLGIFFFFQSFRAFFFLTINKRIRLS